MREWRGPLYLSLWIYSALVVTFTTLQRLINNSRLIIMIIITTRDMKLTRQSHWSEQEHTTLTTDRLTS